LDDWMQRGRRRLGADIVPIGAAGIRRLLKTLRAGGMVGILPDQVPGRAAAGCNVPFMGVTCYTATLPLELLRRSGANALFCFARRVRGGYVVHFQAVEPMLFSDDDVLAAEALNRGVESCVAIAPAQYQWTYKRFRERPRQRPDRYDRMDT
jgi:KDO2-lipid IV(A) lauroyltransferase